MYIQCLGTLPCRTRSLATTGVSTLRVRELMVRLTAPSAASAAARHFTDSVDELFEYSLRDLQPNDMRGISVHNAEINKADR